MSDSLRPQRRFQLVLIKPSHYDDDGYVIQWFRSVMPSNSLGALYGLAIDTAERQVRGADVSIAVTPVDETNIRVKPKKMTVLHAERAKRSNGATPISAARSGPAAPLISNSCAPGTRSRVGVNQR